MKLLLVMHHGGFPGWLEGQCAFCRGCEDLGEQGEKKKKKKTLSADLATLGHFPSPKKGGGEKTRTRAKVREGEMKKEKKQKNNKKKHLDLVRRIQDGRHS